MSRYKSAALGKDEIPLPHPAEDLSMDDDLLSWILVDQLGCMPNSRLGVHPQENKFVGPVFKTDDVLQIVRETVIHGNVQGGMAKLQEFPLIQAHIQSKRTDTQRERFIQHLRRYLLCYTPTSRVDIHSTDRYSHVSKHPELAVFATRPLPVGSVLQELQGSVVPLPEEWREEMDLGDDYDLARAAAGQESDASDEEEEEELEEEEEAEPVPRRKGKEVERGQRRSDRTRRRDFSIVWSGLKRCYQLFLGPARFLNHDCSPTVELLRQGNHVTFRIIRAVRIGEELTAYYGDNYFGKDNNECLCLTCEQNQRGQFKPAQSRSGSLARSEASMTPQKPKLNRPSNLRRECMDSNPSEASASEVLEGVGPEEGEEGEEEVESGEGSESDSPEPIVRERHSRLAKTNAKPWNLHKRSQPPPSDAESSIVDEDLPEDFPRCGSCAKPLHDRMWYAGRYFDHCARCTRHAFIYGLPWPAHRQSEVQEYPPSHLIPNGYIPRKISTIPLPSLQKKKFKEVLVEVPPDDPIPVSREYRHQLRLRKEIAMEDFTVQSLRETAWTVQVAQEEAVIASAAAAAAKIEARRLAQEEKKRRDANTIKGSGVWQRYEYVSESECKRREDARNAPTHGTRRGRAYKVEEPADDEGDDREDRPEPTAEVPDQAVGGPRVIHRVAIPSEPKRKAKKAKKAKLAKAVGPQAKTKRPLTSPTIRLYVGTAGQSPKSGGGSGSGSSTLVEPTSTVRKRAATSDPTSSPSAKPLKKVRRLPTSPHPTDRSHAPKPTPLRPTLHPSHPSTSTEASGSNSTSSSEIKKRGRPRGSGKHQIAAAKAEESRRLSLSSSVAGPSYTGTRSESPIFIPQSHAQMRFKKGSKVRAIAISDDEEDLEDGIEVIVQPVMTPSGAVKSKTDKIKEKDKNASGGSSSEKKVRSFFPSHLPILKLGR